MLINPENSPKVIMLIGKNKSFKIGRTIAYKIVKTKLAIAKVIKLEKPTVGSPQAKIPKVNAVISIALIILISIIEKLKIKVN